MATFVHPSGSDDLVPVTELFEAVLEQAEMLEPLGPVERQLWASGALATWRDEFTVASSSESAASTVDAEFLVWLGEQNDPSAAMLGGAVGAVLEGPSGVVLRGASRIGTAVALDAAEAVELSRETDDDGHSTAFSVLAEIDDGRLVDLRPGPAVADLLEAIQTADEALDVQVDLPLDVALREIAAAWNQRSADPGDDIADSLVLNQGATRRWLTEAGADTLPELSAPPGPASSFNEGLSDNEVAEGNLWASGVLRSALRSVMALPDPAGIASAAAQNDTIKAAAIPLHGPITHLHAREQEALCWLEWADWLGVLIGVGRAAPGTSLTPDRMLEMLESSSEVTSEIPEADHDWLLFAFSVALAVWIDEGVLSGKDLAADEAQRLVLGALWAWRSRD